MSISMSCQYAKFPGEVPKEQETETQVAYTAVTIAFSANCQASILF